MKRFDKFNKTVGIDMSEMVSILPTKIQRLYFGLLALGYTQFETETERTTIINQINSWNSVMLSAQPVDRKYTFTNLMTHEEIEYRDITNKITKKVITAARFTKDELRLLDGLDIELSEMYREYFQQSIDDWWNMK